MYRINNCTMSEKTTFKSGQWVKTLLNGTDRFGEIISVDNNTKTAHIYFPALMCSKFLSFNDLTHVVDADGLIVEDLKTASSSSSIAYSI